MKERWQVLSERWQSTVHRARTVGANGRVAGPSASLRWLLAIILGAGTALIGPYGTYLFYGLPLRFAYWITVVLVSFAVWEAIDRILTQLFSKQSYALRRAVIILPFALINSAAITGLHWIMSWWSGGAVPVVWLELVVSHIILSVLIITPTLFIIQQMRQQVETEAGSEVISFLTEKLPPQLKGIKPFALSAEGHYVLVYTSQGKELVTMRFEDAVRAVAGINGLQTHRSWWVALDEISDIRSSGSAYEAVLKTGLIVPVSRRRKTALNKRLSA